MHRTLLVHIVLSLCLATGSYAAEVPNHPAVTPYTGSIVTRRDEDGFRSYSLVTAVNESGKTDEEALQTLKVEGNVIRLAYENPKERSPHEIYSNYRQGFEQGGFEILFACAARECGPAFASSRWGRVTGLRYLSPDMRYIAAKSTRDGQVIYVAVLVAKRRHQVEIVEVEPMESGLATIQVIGEGLMLNGRVALEGIYFDTDKATIKPESKRALDVIAGYLADNPSLNVYIVGHTDSDGETNYNLQLSRNRAAAVVETLVNRYKVQADRLAAHGVGPLAA